MEKPRGDKVLSDHGARRELAQALAEGVAEHLADVRRRVGAARVVVQLDEPALPAVLAGRIPTASGFGRHRVVHPPEASDGAGVGARGGRSRPVGALLCGRGALAAAARGRRSWAERRPLGATADDMDVLAEALEAGETLALGVVPSLEPATPPDAKTLTERVLRWLDMLGLDLEAVSDRLVVTPSCGLAGASPAWARRATELCREVAGHLSG